MKRKTADGSQAEATSPGKKEKAPKVRGQFFLVAWIVGIVAFLRSLPTALKDFFLEMWDNNKVVAALVLMMLIGVGVEFVALASHIPPTAASLTIALAAVSSAFAFYLVYGVMLAIGKA